MSEIIETDLPDAADIAVIADGLRAYNTAMAGTTITVRSPYSSPIRRPAR